MIGAAPTDPPTARAGYLPATAAAQRTASLTSRTPTTTSTTSDNASNTSNSELNNNNNNTHNSHSHTSSSSSTSGLKPPPQPSAENMDSSRRRSSLQPPPQSWDHHQGPSPAAASRRSNSHAHADAFAFDDRRSSMQTPAWEQQPQSDGTYLSPSNALGNQRQSRSSVQQPLSERHRRSSSQQPASSSGLRNPEEYGLSQGGERRASMQESSSPMQQQQQQQQQPHQPAPWEQGGERRASRASRASGQLAQDARSDRRSQSSMQQPSWEQDRRLSAQRSDRRSHSSFQQPSWEQERRTSTQLASNGPPDRRSQSSMQQPSWEKQGQTGTHMPETSHSDRRSQSSIQQPSWEQQSTTNPSPAEGSRRRSHSHMEEPLSHHEPQTVPWQSNEQDSQDIRRPPHDVVQTDAVYMAPPPSRESEMPPSYLRAPPRQYMQPHDINYHPTYNPSSSGAAPVGQSEYYAPQYAGSSHSGPTSYVEQPQSADAYYGSQGPQVVQPAYNPDAQFSPGSEHHAQHYPQQHPQQYAQQYPAHMQPPPRQSSTHRPGGRGPLPQHLSSGSWELRPTALAAPAAELAAPSSIYTSATESSRLSQEDDAALAASVADLDIAERSESPGSEAPRPTFRKMTVKRAARDPTVAVKPQGPAPAEQTPAETAHVTKVSFEKTLGLYRENALRSEDGDLKFMFAKYCIEESGKAPDQKIRDKMIEEGFGLLKELGKSGNAEAMYTLGQAYLDDNQYGLAHSQLLGAAKRSHSGAMYLLGLTYEKGAGVKQNTRVAMDYYTKSAQAGYKPALYRLGMIELFGQLSGGKRDVRKGIMWLKRGAAVADREHPECLHQLALVFEDGIPPHAQQDENYAYGLLVEAAELDYAPSQYKLACCYEFERLGCERDLGEALHWYSLAAENDNADAQFALAGWYLQGLEPFLPADPQKAYAWTYRAAMKDHSKAQYAIGYFCELGIGCQQNAEKADRWYKLAAALGEERAIAKVGPIPLAKSKKDKSMGAGSSSASAPFSQGNSAAVKEGKKLFSFLKK
ncbi:hypothetical protein HDU88_007222 [Geranomyces variabilis]|nr:hypothetical protein HDU88_007222 [Geranomyces variabilis]